MIAMGENYRVKMMAARASTIRRDYQCLTIEIGTDLSQATTALQSHVPADAKVFLITDAPLDDIATIRAALPTPENIIEEVKVDDSVDATELQAYRALQTLPDAQPVTPTADLSAGQELVLDRQGLYQVLTHAPPNPEGLGDSNDDHLLEGLSGRLSGMYRSPAESASASIELSQLFQLPGPLRDESEPRHFFSPSSPQGSMQLLSGNVASQSAAARPLQRPETAEDPTTTLSKALDLGQGFCDSTEWQHLAQAQNLSLLAKLVTRSLRGAKNTNLKAMLRRLVEEMTAKPKLAERIFVRLLGADESCGDRVSLGLSWAQEEWLAQPVWDKSLNHDLPKVIEIARQVFRRRLIEELARQKVEDINKVRRAANQPEHTEDVETLLALLAGLHGPLELGGEKPDAEFTGFRISGVTPEDIEKARWDVLAREGEQGGKHLWEFIATWTPWQEAVMGDLYPDEVAEIKNVLSDPDRPARLEREATTEIEKANVSIESVPIQFRQGHITRRASQLEQEEALQLWLPLTMKAWSNRED